MLRKATVLILRPFRITSDTPFYVLFLVQSLLPQILSLTHPFGTRFRFHLT